LDFGQRVVERDDQQVLEHLGIIAVDDVLGGTFCPTDGIASPNDVTFGYAAAARRLGARIREGVDVTGIDLASGRASAVRTAAGSIATKAVFNCAGPWAAQIGRMVNVDVPVLPFRRHIFVTDTFPAVPRDNPMTIDFTTGFYFPMVAELYHSDLHLTLPEGYLFQVGPLTDNARARDNRDVIYVWLLTQGDARDLIRQGYAIYTLDFSRETRRPVVSRIYRPENERFGIH